MNDDVGLQGGVVCAFALLQAQIHDDGAGQREVYKHMTPAERWWATVCLAGMAQNLIGQACRLANVDQDLFLAQWRANLENRLST